MLKKGYLDAVGRLPHTHEVLGSNLSLRINFCEMLRAHKRSLSRFDIVKKPFHLDISTQKHASTFHSKVNHW